MAMRGSSPAAGMRASRFRCWLTLAVICTIVGGLLCTASFLWAFLRAPLVSGANLSNGAVALINGTAVSTRLLLSQKIFYFHVPVAVVSLVFIMVSAVYSICFLARQKQAYDTRARICMLLGLIFIVATMITGDLWTRHDWGVWWVWEPRLTTYFILMLLAIGYFILRSAIDDPAKRARMAAVLAILAAIDAPLSFVITRMVPSSIHPVIFRSDSGLPPNMLIPFLMAIFGMLILSFGLYQLRLRTEEQALELEDLKQRYEDLRSAAVSRPSGTAAPTTPSPASTTTPTAPQA